MRLSKSTDYAIRILVYCAAQDGELVKVAELSKRLDITEQNTFKIVHLLSRAGFLRATRGRYGGVCLALPAKDIRIGQVVREIEAVRAGGMGGPAKSSARRDKGLAPLVDEAFNAFIAVLDAQTLADLAAAQRPRKSAKKSKAAKPVKKSGRSRANLTTRTATKRSSSHCS